MSGGKKHSLRFKISLTIIIVVVLTLLSVSIVFFINTQNISRTLIQSNQEMGVLSRDKSSIVMSSLSKIRLEELATDKAALADRIFQDFESAVCMAATAAETLYRDAAKYSPREVELPQMENEGKLAVQVLYASDTNPADEAIRQEVQLLGNIQDTLYAINLNTPNVASNYIATESGIMIQADSISGKKFDESGNIMPLNAKNRPWYTGAKESGQPYLTPVVRDLHTPRLAIMCGVPIYLNDEFKAVAGAGMYLDDVEALVQGMELGDSGLACIVNQVGQVLFSSATGEEEVLFYPGRDLIAAKDAALNVLGQAAIAHEKGLLLLELNHISCYIAYAPMKTTGWSVFMMLPQLEAEASSRQLKKELEEVSYQASAEAQAQLRRSLLILAALLASALLLALVVSLILSRRIVTPIRKLTEQVQQIEGDNLDFHWDLNTNDETQVLANSFESLTGRMQNYISDIRSITAEKERIGTELSLATRIQADMLPNIFPAFPWRKDFDIYASMIPAKEVGGDFYDFFLIDDDHLALVIADVSGKGIPAALFMMVSKILIQNQVMNGLSPAKVLEKINEQICSNNREEMFVTVWLGILNLKTGLLRAANAGHEYPVLKQPDGHFELIRDKHGFVIGGLPGMDYTEYEWQLEPGAKIFVYTDGVPEAGESHSELFGTDRMIEALRAVEDQNPEQILAGMDAAVRAYAGKAPQFDDQTMLCVHYFGQRGEAGAGGKQLDTRSSLDRLREVTEFINTELDTLNCPPRAKNQVDIAVDEVFSNIVHYAYDGAEGPVRVCMTTQEESRSVTIRFMDRGKPFNPLTAEDPDISLSAEDRPIGGLGIYLVKKTMDDVRYEFRDGQNILTLEKTF